jgi:uncharacterized membrane protein YfcA
MIDEHPMSEPGASRVGRTTEIVFLLLTVIGVIIFAVWSRSAFSVLFAVYVIACLVVYWWKRGGESEEDRMRRVEKFEKEMIPRVNKALETKDDPNEIARWVP